MVKLTCEYCGKAFLRQKSNIRKHIFCGRKCFFASKIIKYGKRPIKKQVLTTCAYCSIPIYRWEYAIKRNPRHFCGKKCKGKWMSINLCAEKAVNWKGGVYSTIARTLCNSRYRRIRAQVITLDGRKCVLCSSIIRLEVHHIIEKGKNSSLLFDVLNMVTLCKKCHCDIRGKEELFIGHFSDIVDKRANSVKPETDNAVGNTEPSRANGSGVRRDYIPSSKEMI